MSITCDKCGHEFELKADDIKEQYVGQWGRSTFSRTYFRCPSCLKKYVGSYHSRKIDLIIEKVKELQRRIKDDPSSTDRYVPKIDTMREWLRSTQAELKARVW